MIKEDKLYELIIADDSDEIYAISMVSEPAIESDWVYFDKNKIKVEFAEIDTEKRLVMGAILIPDKKILRLQEDGTPYYVYLKPETIQKLSEKYLQSKYNDQVTIEHQKAISDISLVESWIVASRTKDKSAMFGLSLPVGTWAGTMKVNNDKIWNEFVKTKKLSGFSIEGIFSHKEVNASKLDLEKEIAELNEEEAFELLTHIKALLEGEGDKGAQPTFPTPPSYAGEGPDETKKKKKDYIHPALVGTKK
jgi:hypothetical protein